MPLQPGETLLNKYQVVRLLGEGGFGYVYESLDINLNRRVAIKEMRPELSANEEMLKRFVGEARSVSDLNDPHIVAVYGFERDGNHHYMILEFMDGGNLANLLSHQPVLPPSQAALIAKAICDGLAAVHSKGIVHRDMKPSNILLKRDGITIKISDFGISHVPRERSGFDNLTRMGTSMGTTMYMSPEQARGEPADARGDLYSVGVMLYEMACGYRYMDFSSDVFRDIELVKTMEPRPLPPAVPNGLQRIILRALAKDPAQRFQSAQEMSSALQAFVAPPGTVMVQSKSQINSKPIPPSPRKPQRNNQIPVIVGGLVVLVLVVIGIIAVVITQTPMPTPTRVTLLAVTEVPGAPAVSTTGISTPVPPPTLSASALQTQAVQTYQAAQAATLASQTAVARSTESIINAARTIAAQTVIAIRPTVAPTIPPTTAPTATARASATPPPSTAWRFRLDPVTSSARGDIFGINLFDSTANTYAPIYGDSGISSAAWSPNGSRILISASVENLKDGAKRVLRVIDPSVDPNTKEFDLVTGDRKGIVTIIQSMCKSGGLCGAQEAIWSPDGQSIAVFYLPGTGASGLFKISPDGRNITGLKTDTSWNVVNYRPRYWSTDGKWIVAFSLDDGKLYTFSVDGRDQNAVEKMGALEVFDERYLPWRRVIAPARCTTTQYFYCDETRR